MVHEEAVPGTASATVGRAGPGDKLAAVADRSRSSRPSGGGRRRVTSTPSPSSPAIAPQAAPPAEAGGPQNRSPEAQPGHLRPDRRYRLPSCRPLLGPAHAPGQPGTGGGQPGAAFDHHEREPGAADQQQVDQRVLAQMMRQRSHVDQLVKQ